MSRKQKSIPLAQTNGFTLIEMAIVLVVIGLLVGGVLTGRALIRASEIRSVSSDKTQFATSLNTFKGKYFALPGDMRDATAYWGGTVTNGNGNGRIDYTDGSAGEEYAAWQHLGRSNLVAGDFDGTASSMPTAKLSGAVYRISYKTDVYGHNGLMISLNAINPGHLANRAILSPNDVIVLDQKEDDGLADSGDIMGFNQEGVPGCVTADYTAGSGDYITNSDDIRCKVFFVISR